MKCGLKTTEFWLGLIFMAASFGVLVYAIKHGSNLLGLAAVLGAIGSNSAIYIYGRSKVKAGKE